MQFAVNVDKAESKRAQRRIMVRRSVEAAAWSRFRAQGYDSTTVDQIAEDAGISQRTFFRYYDSKEAVLFGDWQAQLKELVRWIEKAQPDLTPLAAVRSAIMRLAQAVDSDREQIMLRSTLSATSPGARDYYRQAIMPAWENALAEALAARMRVDPEADLRPRTLAGAAIAALNAAQQAWVNNGCAELLPDLTEQALDFLTQMT